MNIRITYFGKFLYSPFVRYQNRHLWLWTPKQEYRRYRRFDTTNWLQIAWESCKDLNTSPDSAASCVLHAILYRNSKRNWQTIDRERKSGIGKLWLRRVDAPNAVVLVLSAGKVGRVWFRARGTKWCHAFWILVASTSTEQSVTRTGFCVSLLGGDGLPRRFSLWPKASPERAAHEENCQPAFKRGNTKGPRAGTGESWFLRACGCFSRPVVVAAAARPSSDSLPRLPNEQIEHGHDDGSCCPSHPSIHPSLAKRRGDERNSRPSTSFLSRGRGRHNCSPLPWTTRAKDRPRSKWFLAWLAFFSTIRAALLHVQFHQHSSIFHTSVSDPRHELDKSQRAEVRIKWLRDMHSSRLLISIELVATKFPFVSCKSSFDKN